MAITINLLLMGKGLSISCSLKKMLRSRENGGCQGLTQFQFFKIKTFWRFVIQHGQYT